MRKVLLFKIDGEIVLEESINLTLLEIEEMKQVISYNCNVSVETIEVEMSDENIMSDFDVTLDGLICWTDAVFKPYKGLRLPFEFGSNQHLDAIKKGNLIDLIEFT